MFHYEKRLNLYIITSFLSKHILIGLILKLCGLFMRLPEITYQIIGFKSNFIRPNQWIFLATQTPFHSRFFFLKVKKTKPRKDNGKNKTLCQHFTCICSWNYCSCEAFFSRGIIIVGGPFSTLVQPNLLSEQLQTYTFCHVLKNCFEKNKEWSYVT